MNIKILIKIALLISLLFFSKTIIANTTSIDQSEEFLISLEQETKYFNSKIMNDNKELIEKFYTAFQQKDYETMKSCYGENLIFNDPVFQNLNYTEASNMWEMLIKRGKDMVLTFDNIESNENGGTANWQAIYTFGGNKVVNKIAATFVIEDGKIIQHTDDFSFQKWSGQALGVVGKLFGWTNFIKKTVRTKARKDLDKYIERK